jgi:hypothetical protein
MSKMFSFIELTADNDVTAEDFVCGNPLDTDDMENVDVFINLLETHPEIETVRVDSKTYLWGEGESDIADDSELEQIRVDEDFTKRDDVDLIYTHSFTAWNQNHEQAQKLEM